MARKMMMTWCDQREGWLKKYGGNMYSVSCRQLGVEPTKEASWRAARAWWEAKQVEVDAIPAPFDDGARLSALIHAASVVEEYPDKPMPRELKVAILGSARVDELERSTRALLARPDPDRTVGRRAEAWHQSLLAGVDAGRIDVSRYGAYRRNVAVFVDWIGSATKVESLAEETLERFYAEMAARVRDARYSPDYARSIFGATKTFLSWLTSNRTIPPLSNLTSKTSDSGRAEQRTSQTYSPSMRSRS